MAVVAVAVLGWVGYSAVDYYQNNQPRESVEVDYSAVDDYLESISE